MNVWRPQGALAPLPFTALRDTPSMCRAECVPAHLGPEHESAAVPADLRRAVDDELPHAAAPAAHCEGNRDFLGELDSANTRVLGQWISREWRVRLADSAVPSC